VPEWYSHTEVCDYLMERCVAIHLDSPGEKFSMVGVMLKKLLTFVQKKCVVEGADSLMMHEIVLGGHLYLQLIKVLFFLLFLRDEKFSLFPFLCSKKHFENSAPEGEPPLPTSALLLRFPT
jgi:hypothetical protein